MSKVLAHASAFLLFTAPLLAQAADVFNVLNLFISFFSTLIPIILALAVAVFFWGMVKFIAHADDEKAVAEGKSIMVWGVVGIGVMTLLWAIVGYLQRSLGINVTGSPGNAPNIPTVIPT